MQSDLETILDTCIDLVDSGASIDTCVKSYPEHAAELEPLLRVVCDAGQAWSLVPRAAAKSTQRLRLDAALAEYERGHTGCRNSRWIALPSFGWSRALVAVPIVLLLGLLGFGLHWGLTPGAAPVIAQDNFRLLVSDEENAIGEFRSLEVAISEIRMLHEGESDHWEVINLEQDAVVDLTQLQGLNAKEVWRGSLPEGQYAGLFMNIEDVNGILTSGDAVKAIVQPEDMRISKSFEVRAGEGSGVDFVYDITVVAAESRQRSASYILLPQVEQSGANQRIHEVGEGKLILRVVDGEVAPGGNVTVLAAFEGDPVAGALVTINDSELGTTSADGRIFFIVPSEDELEIKAVKGELEGALKIDLVRESNGPYRGGNQTEQEGNGPEPESNGPYQEGNGPEPESNGPYQEGNGPEQESNGPYQEGNGPEQESNGPYQEGNGPEQESNGPYQEGNGPEQESSGPYQEGNGPEQESNEPYQEGGEREPDPDGPQQEPDGPGHEPDSPEQSSQKENLTHQPVG